MVASIPTSFGNATILELLWLASGLVSYRYSRRTLRRAKANRAGLRESKLNGRYMLAANRNVQEANSLVRKSLVIVVVGLVASATPTAHPAPHITPVGIVVTAGLMILSGLITAASISASRYYDRFDAYAAERELRNSRRGDA